MLSRWCSICQLLPEQPHSLREGQNIELEAIRGCAHLCQIHADVIILLNRTVLAKVNYNWLRGGLKLELQLVIMFKNGLVIYSKLSKLKTLITFFNAQTEVFKLLLFSY